MSERPGRDPSGRRRHRTHHDERQDQPSGAPRTEETVDLRGTQALERLRDRVQAAAGEILRLREENAALAERITRLESRAGGDIETGTLLHLDEDPEAIRRKVNGFIEAIDQYLQSEQT